MAPNARPSFRINRVWLPAVLLALAAVLPVLADSPELPKAPTTPPATQLDHPRKPKKDPELERDLDGIEDFRDIRPADMNPLEYQAYNEVLTHAREVDPQDLRSKAKDVPSFQQLKTSPKKYRGNICHIEGQLRKLVPLAATQRMANEGVKSMYEASIFPKLKDGVSPYPYIVLFTELPEGVKLEPQDDYKVNYQISCDAYFFKIYRYANRDGSKHDAPLLMGHTFTLNANQAEAEGGWQYMWTTLIIGGLVLVGVLVGLFVGLNWWFRRGDLITQRRLALAREAPFSEPPTENGSVEPSSEEVKRRDEAPPM